MSLVLTTAGLQWLLNSGRGGMVATPSLVLRLFRNDYVPVKSSLVTDMQEANFPGYAQINLNAWGPVGPDANNDALVEETSRTFGCTGSGTPNTIYGYYVVEPVSGVMLWAERSTAPPVAMDAGGKSYIVKPRVQLRNFSS